MPSTTPTRSRPFVLPAVGEVSRRRGNSTVGRNLFNSNNSPVAQVPPPRSSVSPTKPGLPLPGIAGRSSSPNGGAFPAAIDSKANLNLAESGELMFGMAASQSKLNKIKKMKVNSSPFDSSSYLPMLPPASAAKKGKILLLLDLDETLVHASFVRREGVKYDVVVNVENGASSGDIFIAYRPGVQKFLEAIAPLFEVAVFTASQSCYANPLLDKLDPQRELIQHRLFREHCCEVNGARVKDLSLLGRPLDRVAIIDNSPVAYLFQPRNAIPIASWFEDPKDDELAKLIPILTLLASESTVYNVLDVFNSQL